MKIRSLKTILAVVGASLLMVSCATTETCGDEPFVSAGREIGYDAMLKMTPFTAKVETITIDHPFFLSATSVHLWLKRPDTVWRVDLGAYPASPAIIGFARSLRVCQDYEFPKVYLDYLNGQGTNAPAK